MISISKARLAAPALALVAVVAFAGVASAAPATSLQTFGDGAVTISRTGFVTLDNGTNPDGSIEHSGVYLKSKSQNGKLLKDVDFKFTSSGDVAGGAPRLSIPLSTGSYAFLDAPNCGITSGATGVVSTDLANCPVYINTGGSYANWDAMAAANPTWRISSSIPFVIADGTVGHYVISNIVLR